MKAYYIQCCFLLLITISGCTTVKSANDKYLYQPIVKPPQKVNGIFMQKPYGPVDLGKVEMLYTNIIKWKVNNLKSYNSEDIIWKSDSFLERNNIFSWKYSSWIDGPERERFRPECRELSESDLPDDDRYPWLRHQNAFYLSPVYVPERNAYEDKYIKSIRKEGHKVIKTIVCLEPLIVIVTEGNIINFFESEFIEFEKIIPEYLRVDVRNADGIILKHGYAYGTHIPFSEKMEWFSPDMDILPRPVEIDNNGIGHIKVKWGELIFTKINDEWIVSPKKGV